MGAFDFFQKIYCINLDHRTDRWEHAVKEFSSIGILDKVERFSAIKDEDGRFGVIKSNLAILQKSKEQGLENVLVFEDDVKFLCGEEPLQEALLDLCARDWGLFYLGGNVNQGIDRISKHLLLAKWVYGVHAMAYHKRVFDPVIAKLSSLPAVQRWEDILDVYFSQHIQTNFPCYLMTPMMATQIDSFSDIEKRFVSQHYIEQRFQNNVRQGEWANADRT